MFRYRTGCPWWDVLDRFGPWQTLWERHAWFSKDGTWDRVLGQLVVQADAAGQVDWQLSVDSTVSRVHQHASNLSRRPRWSYQAAQGDAWG